MRLLATHLRLPMQLLLITETSVVFGAVFVAVWLRFNGNIQAFTDVHGAIWPKALVVALSVSISLLALGLYQLRQRLYFRDTIARVIVALAISSMMLGSVWYVLPSLTLGRGVSVVAGTLIMAGLAMVRLYFLCNVDENKFRRRTLVVGSGEKSVAIQQIRRRADRRGFRVVGTVCVRSSDQGCCSKDCLGHERSLLEIALAQRADEIVVAMNEMRGTLPIAQLLACKLGGIDVIDLLAFLERETGKVRIDFMNPSWFIFSRGFCISAFQRSTKRAVDVIVAVLSLLAASPLMLLAAIAIRIEDGWHAPVFFRQCRVGYNGRLFNMLKFRSMIPDAEGDGEARWAAKDDPRITRVGRVLRKLRFDELPQIINVLKGEMSLVGPRPERPEFVKELSTAIPYYSERHTVKPGITGWAQLKYQYAANQRDAIEKLQYDLYYVKNHGLLLDIAIMLQTAEVVLWGKGAR